MITEEKGIHQEQINIPCLSKDFYAWRQECFGKTDLCFNLYRTRNSNFGFAEKLINMSAQYFLLHRFNTKVSQGLDKKTFLQCI